MRLSLTSLTVEVDGAKLTDIPLEQKEVTVAGAERFGMARHRRAELG